MKKEEWINRIKEQCVEIGTYRPQFDDVISTLAMTLQKRDEVEELLDRIGEELITTCRNGYTVKNPLLGMFSDLNKEAVSYWRELGLTPSGLKKINEESFKEKKKKEVNSLLDKLQEKNNGKN